MTQIKLSGAYKQKLLSQLPVHYSLTDFVELLYQAVGAEIDDADWEARYLLDAIDILHLYDWGLAFTERGLGLPTNPGDPLSVRQSRIKQKTIGWGEFWMKNLQQLFSDFGATGIVITPNFSTLSVIVEYINNPVGAEAIKAANQFFPVSIELVPIIATGRTWGDLNNSGISWGDLNTRYTWGGLNS